MKCELVETVLEGAFKGDSNTVIATAVIAESRLVGFVEASVGWGTGGGPLEG